MYILNKIKYTLTLYTIYIDIHENILLLQGILYENSILNKMHLS